MATEYSPQPDRDEDGDLSDLLQQAYGCDSPRPEFVDSLRDTLAEELRSAHSAMSNGKVASRRAAREDGVRAGRLRSSKASAVRSRSAKRSLAAAAMAAAIVTSVILWTSRPSYSWTTMVRALEQQPWIESTAEAETGAGANVRNWFSSVRRIVVRQTEDNIVWDDLHNGVRSLYESGSDVLWQSGLEASETPSTEQALVSFLLNQAGQLPDGDIAQVAGPIEVRRQSWREVEEARTRKIELDVELGWGDSSEERIHLLVTLDPETHLPQLCRVIGDDERDTNVIRFEYPTSGPQQVYDLGVPADVVIRQVPDTGAAVRVAEAPVESKPVEIATRARGTDSTPPDVIIAPAEQQVAEASTTRNAGILLSDGIVAPPIPSVTPSSAEMAQRIDELMHELWQANHVIPVERSTDLEFLRRVYLDLTGRVPTVSEVREFMRDASADRRERLVEQLLSRRDHATHLAAVWRRFLLPEGVDLAQYGGTASFEEWLTDHFRANTAYDQVVRELLLAEGRVSESGPILFYTALKLAPEALAAQTSRAFLGMRLECAQCHDHFFDERWKQEDFWGYAAFFARISRPQGKMEMVSPVLQVKDSNRGDVTLPEQDEIIPPRYPLGGTLDEDPASSRREELADWMTAPHNPHFARATVNRVWAHLFGRGLVEPVDDMRSDHPPISPEVLDELAGYFVATGFDLRDLFHVMVLSQTYQLTSRGPDDDPARCLHFAQMNIKSFTAAQLYDSIAVATRLETPATDDGSLVRTENVSRSSFIDQFQAPPGQTTDYQSGITQALTLMNGGLIQGATGLETSGILRSLQAPFFSDEQRVETLFLATLSRPPDDAERQSMMQYVTSADGNREKRLGDLLWALLNSAEFTLNH